MTLLEVKNLNVELLTKGGYAKALDGINLSLESGEILGIAGESGSGKTMTALTLLGLLPNHSKISGSLKFSGTELVGIDQKRMRDIRGREISMVFQDPMTSLHPMLSIGTQLTEHMITHLGLSKNEAREKAINLLTEVRIPDPQRSLDAVPSQFSGGMRQRICIAMALACDPKLLLADEPTTALDVTVQAGILNLFRRLRDKHGLSIIFITHDLGVMSSLTDRLLVMYAGREVESGKTSTLLQNPRHPYTRGILDSLPDISGSKKKLKAIMGFPPELGKQPLGCAFHNRCPFNNPQCESHVIPLTTLDSHHRFYCDIDPLKGDS